MAAKGGFDYSQFKDMHKNMGEVRKTFNQWFEDFLLREAAIALRLVRPLSPVDSGTLRRMWSISKVERVGNVLLVFLVNPMEYASFMEEGFTVHTNEGDYWWEGFHMAEISVQQVMDKMPAKFEREFAKFMKSFGWEGK